MKITITNATTGEVTTISRSVTTSHPEWIHAQIGTKSESELQQWIDGLSVNDWYRDGEHLGDDVGGVSVWRDENTIVSYRVTDAATSERYRATSPAAAVELFLEGYDTDGGDEGSEFSGAVWDENLQVAAWVAQANGTGGVKKFTVTP